MGRVGRVLIAGVVAVVAALALALPGSAAGTLETFFSFADEAEGAHPWGAVVRAPNGDLFGTTHDGGAGGLGTVFQLKLPASGGTWTRIVLHDFTGGKDGAIPLAGLALAPDGTLYGTTTSGGGGECSEGCGTVYQLLPRPNGKYKYSVIYRFPTVASGTRTGAQLVRDADGVLYGTTSAGGTHDYGTVFALRPDGDTWKRTTLHNFAGFSDDGQYPQSGVVFGPDGALYGTTLAGGQDVGSRGTVYRLKPGAGANPATLSLLHRFTGGSDGEKPIGAVAFAPSGDLFGTTSAGGGGSCFGGCGIVFRLTGKGKNWTEDVVHRFAGGAGGAAPRAGVAVDASGTLWGTTPSGGTGAAVGVIYRIRPPKKDGGAWKLFVEHAFSGTPVDGAIPFSNLVLTGSPLRLYGTTRDGGQTGSGGTVFAFTP